VTGEILFTEEILPKTESEKKLPGF